MINFRDNVKKMEGYVPGEQPPPGSRVIKLNTNENPYPPSPEVMKVLREFEGEWLRRYPDPMATMAREAAAKVYGVPADWVMAANGSDEMLALLARAFLEPGRRIAYPMPTYSLYITLAEMQDAATVEVPYDEGYNLPVEGLLAAQADLTFICTPNNPSATVAPVKDLERLAAGLNGVLVIDEAYTDFADENALGLVSRYENVIVLRTLSKAYSLAGLRVGFGVAQPRLLEGLIKIKDSYNVDSVALRLAAAAMNDQEWMRANAGRIKAEGKTCHCAGADEIQAMALTGQFHHGQPVQGRCPIPLLRIERQGDPGPLLGPSEARRQDAHHRRDGGTESGADRRSERARQVTVTSDR